MKLELIYLVCREQKDVGKQNHLLSFGVGYNLKEKILFNIKYYKIS